MDKAKLLNIGFTKGSKADILEYLVEKLSNTQDKLYIVTPNPEMVVRARQDEKFSSALNKAEVALADGVGIVWAANMMGVKGISRVTGVDFIESLCERTVRNAVKIGFLGGQPGVAERAAKCLKEKYPALNVVFTGSEWGEDMANSKPASLAGGSQLANGIKEENSKKTISNKPYAIGQIDILFVAFGFPKQELWMAENINKLSIRMMMGVGGAFDYFSGEVPRAPKFLRRLGMEWLFRLVVQPWRIKRQLALLRFILMVLREKFRS